MTTVFPGALDTFTNPVGTDDVSVVLHSAQHSNINDAVAAIEAKVGINSSAVTTSLDYKVANRVPYIGANQNVNIGAFGYLGSSLSLVDSIGTSTTADNIFLLKTTAGTVGPSMRFTSASGADFLVTATGSGNTGGAGAYRIFDFTALVNRLWIAASGKIGMGVDSSTAAKNHIVDTGEQQRLGYDTSNYHSAVVSSTGAVNFTATGSGAAYTFGSRVVNTLPLRLKGYTVATLPVGTQGDTAFVTDAIAPTFLGVLTGGGTTVAPVFYNGTAWVSQ